MVPSFLALMASSSKMIIAGRAIQGMGGAGLLSGAFNVVAALFTAEKRPRAC